MRQRVGSLFGKPSFSVLTTTTIMFALIGLAFSSFFASVLAATPVINNVAATNITSTSASISWTTDVGSDTQIEYGLTTSYGSSTSLNSALVTSHTQNVTGLQPNRLYHYRVKSRDALGDLATSSDRTFITALGATTPGSSTDSSNSNTMNGTKLTTVNGGRVSSLSVYVGAVDPSVTNRNFQLAIYGANGNLPSNLIANTATGTLVANTWNTLPINATLEPNTGYFIMYNTNGTGASYNNMRYTSGGTSGWKPGGQAFGAWPTSFGSFTAQAVTFSLYASFAGDTTPPTVGLSAPTEGSTLTGISTISATATDDTGVASVQFKAGTQDLGTDTTAPYEVSWDTTVLLNGPQSLTATAIDSNGNTATSQAVNVNLSNGPKVIVTQPTAGQTLTNVTSVTVTYKKAGDWLPGDGKHLHLRLDGGPTKMDFDSDNNQSYTLIDVPAGSHSLEAIVADGSHVELPGTGGTIAFSTTAPDATPPTVSLTAPAPSATVSNTVNVTATASDETGVVGVQFLLDGNALGAEDTTAPYSVSWNTTTAINGPHTLTAQARDSVNRTTSASVSVNVQNNDPRATVGEWSPLMNWPLVAVHSTLMHTGELLLFDAWESPSSFAKVWNPTTGTFTNVTVDAGLFCAVHVTAANGDVITMGGHTPDGGGIKNIMAFNPTTKTWTRKTDMRTARWYPGAVQLPDNRIPIFSGQIVQGTFADTPEIFNPTTNTSTNLPFTTPQLHEIQYPLPSVLTNGKVVTISPEQGSTMLYDPATNGWSNLGNMQVPYGAWTMLAPNKFLFTGGAANFDSYNPSNPVPSQKTAKILDMTSGTPVWTSTSNMNFARSFHNNTTLPDGSVFTVGGSTTLNDYSTVGTLTSEMWNPTTGSWTQMASPQVPRMYHSTSVLLPDGRVLSAGGGRLGSAPDQLNAQIYSPPYLFRGPRPTIASAPSTIAHNSTMNLTSPEAGDIQKVVLTNLGSITHMTDWNQRHVELDFTRDGNTLTVNTPANTNIAPENYYMVWIINGDGVPSVAKIVKLGVPDTAAPELSAIQASAVTSTTATVSWNSNEASDTQVEYGPTTGYGFTTALDPAMTATHSQNLTGLTPATTYHYRVKSRDGAGNLAVSNNFTFTTAPPDTTRPTVSLSAPANGATVASVIQVSAAANDDVGVIGVQFKLGGANLSTEDTSAPYSVSWNTTTIANGSHTLTAVARDAAGNTTTSSPVTVTVNNTGPSGLVGAWNFNEGSGSILSDLSGNANNGSIFQAAWNASGKYGRSLTFDGSNDTVTIPDSSSLDLTNRMTIEAWVRPTASSGWRTVLMKENTAELVYGMYARESSNRPSGWMRTTTTSGSSLSAGATPALPLNAWSHMATTYDGTNLRLYINGTLRATRAVSGTMPVSANPLKLGGNAIWGEYFAGQIDEVRIYNRALGPSEIQTDMNTPL